MQFLEFLNSAGGLCVLSVIVTFLIGIIAHKKNKSIEERDILPLFFYTYALISSVAIITFVGSNSKILIFGKSQGDLLFPLTAGFLAIVINAYKYFYSKFKKT